MLHFPGKRCLTVWKIKYTCLELCYIEEKNVCENVRICRPVKLCICLSTCIFPLVAVQMLEVTEGYSCGWSEGQCILLRLPASKESIK
jgi:hypothetical protein